MRGPNCLAGLTLFCVLMVTQMIQSQSQGIQSPVNTTSGFVTGKAVSFRGKQLMEFKMVPYAEPPIGDLRFKPSQMKIRDINVIDGTQGNYKVCPQPMTFLTELEVVVWGLVPETRNFTEDCLYLDVYVPQSATPTNLLPVLFWIHGGGYTTGTGRLASGRVLAADYEIVVVSINYRLGALGFLNTGDNYMVGDLGLRDQILALQWVNNNIAQFGGDPARITLGGESAGSSSIAQLMTSPLTEGLFKRTILESGGLKTPWSCLPVPKVPTTTLALKLNCSTESSQEIVDCLKSKRWEQIVMYQGTTWAPACSGGLIPYTQEELDTTQRNSDVAKRLAKINILSGLTSQEGAIAFSLLTNNSRDAQGGVTQETADFAARILLATSGLSANHTEKLLPSVRFLYTDFMMPDSTLARSKQVINMFGDLYFVSGLLKYIHFHRRVEIPAADKGQAYLYLLKHRPSWMAQDPWQYGADHGDDLFFVFGNPIEYPNLNATGEEVILSQTIMTYWTNFVKTGNPNTPITTVNSNPLISWPVFELENQTYLQLDVPRTGVSPDQRLFPKRTAFWWEYFPAELERLRAMKPQKPCKKTPSGSSVNLATLCTTFISAIIVLLLHR